MNKNGLTISVIIPTWKRPEKLKICLECIALQDLPPNEVKVVVRPEDSDGINIVQSFNNRIHNLEMVYSHNIGVVAAENSGLRCATSELIAFIDDDGYAPRDWIKKIINFFNEFPDASAVGGSDIIAGTPWEYHDHEKNEVGLLTSYGRVIGNHHRKITGGIRQVQILKGVNMAFRRNSFTFLDERLAGKEGNLGNGSHWELDICLQVIKSGGKIFFNPDLVVTHDSNHTDHVKMITAKNNTHNLTFVLLKNLAFPRKLLFLIYALVVGNSQLPGIVMFFYDFLKNPSGESIQYSLMKFRGFVAGVQTYLRSIL